MNSKLKQKLIKSLKGELLFDEPLANHTTYHIGGNIDCLFFPTDKADLLKLVQIIKRTKIDITFFGAGSNLLVSDNGLKGIGVSLKNSLNKLQKTEKKQIFVEAGVPLSKLVKQGIAYRMWGIENLTGIPGTVGGALKMNAGAFGSTISQYLVKATVLTRDGIEKIYNHYDIRFSYRFSTFRDDEIIIDGLFDGDRGKKAIILENAKRIQSLRENSQLFLNNSAGSTFKNPSRKYSAGYLIEQTGLKGAKSGAAEISKLHANFIINTGGASSADILSLIGLARNEVAKKFSIKLDLEVKLLGFTNKQLKSIEIH